MKTLLKISILIFSLLAFNACNLKEALTVNVDVNDKVIDFELGPDGPLAGVPRASRVAAATRAEIVLLDSVFNVNVAQKLQEQKLSIDMIKAFTLTKATLIIPIPEEYINNASVFMDKFKNIKLYFDNQNNLVAKASETVTANGVGTINIQIVNADLLDKFKKDQLHVILTGDGYPPKRIKASLKTSYRVKVGM